MLVFSNCGATMHYVSIGLSGKVVCLRGQIEATEIESVCVALETPYTADVLWAVRVMAAEAASVHNARVR